MHGALIAILSAGALIAGAAAADAPASAPAPLPRAGLIDMPGALAVRRSPKPTERPKPRSVASTSPVKVTNSRSIWRAATQPDEMKLGELSLVGVFGVRARREALLRLKTGEMRRVAEGDRIGDWRIARIDAAEVTLRRRDERLTLDLP